MARKFEVHLSTDNAAFASPDGEEEVARILVQLAQRVLAGSLQPEEPLRLHDVNGNRVGYALWHETH